MAILDTRHFEQVRYSTLESSQVMAGALTTELKIPDNLHYVHTSFPSDCAQSIDTS